MIRDGQTVRIHSRGVTAALWALAVFLTWTAIFDDAVVTSATVYTRQQIRRHERGEPTLSITEGFSPSVTRAAWHASAWAGAVALVGVWVVWRLPRHP